MVKVKITACSRTKKNMNTYNKQYGLIFLTWNSCQISHFVEYSGEYASLWTYALIPNDNFSKMIKHQSKFH